MRKTTKWHYNTKSTKGKIEEKKTKSVIKSRLQKGWKKLKIYFAPFMHPSFLVSFVLSWLVTNGQWYIMMGLGIWFKIPTLTKIGTTILLILWNPICLEGLIQLPLALLIQEKWFSKDEKAKQELKRMLEEARHDARRVLHKIRQFTKGEDVEEANIVAKLKLEKAQAKIDRKIQEGATFNDLRRLYAKIDKIESERERKVLRREYNRITYEVKEHIYREGVVQKTNNGLYTAQDREVELAKVEIEGKKTGTIELVGCERRSLRSKNASK